MTTFHFQWVLSERNQNAFIRFLARTSSSRRVASHRSIATTHLMRFPDVFVPAGPLFERVHVDERKRRTVPCPSSHCDVVVDDPTPDAQRGAAHREHVSSVDVSARFRARVRAVARATGAELFHIGVGSTG